MWCRIALSPDKCGARNLAVRLTVTGYVEASETTRSPNDPATIRSGKAQEKECNVKRHWAALKLDAESCYERAGAF